MPRIEEEPVAIEVEGEASIASEVPAIAQKGEDEAGAAEGEKKNSSMKMPGYKSSLLKACRGGRMTAWKQCQEFLHASAHPSNRRISQSWQRI